MSDRRAELRALAADLRDRSRVADAWLAKSFTDRLFVVELESGESLPAPVESTVRAAGLEPYNELHDVPAADAAFAGDVAGSRRFQYVDVESRGSLQSYVVE
jgi:hypothetical protein